MTEELKRSSQPLRLDAVWVAEQFARIGVTLEYVKDATEKQAIREEAQDKYIEQLARDIAEVKVDIRSLKEAKAPRVSPFVAITAIVAAAGFILSLLNQLYGAQ